MIIRNIRLWLARATTVAVLMLVSGHSQAVSINQCASQYDSFNQVAHDYYGEDIHENWNVLGATGYVTLDWLNSLDDLEGLRGGRNGWQQQGASNEEVHTEDDLRYEQMRQAHIGLLLCLYDHRIAELEADSAAVVPEEEIIHTPAGGDEDDAEPCSAATARTIDQRLAEIDARVQRFLETPLGKQQGSATPMLQVILWATSEQRDAIGAGCAEQATYRQRIQELNASYNGALKACQQIQSRPAVCGPSSPEEVLDANPFTEEDQSRMDQDEQQRRDVDWSKVVPKVN